MYSKVLESYKHDIAERHRGFRGFLDEVLTKDPEGENLLRSYHSKTNPVRMMHKVIEHCLKTEERSRGFLKVLSEREPYLYHDLKTYGPRGKFVRKDAPAVEFTDMVCAALGDKVSDLLWMPLLPCYNRGITCIMAAMDVVLAHDQLLPEEYAEFMLHGNDEDATKIVTLEQLCRDHTIPEPTRQFISLVVSSFNMHVFDIPNMTMKDVFVFA